MSQSVKLHVNVDHVATVREARKISEPDPVLWAREALAAGADGITCHLRQDRRHIVDSDVRRLRASSSALFNLECSLNPEMVAIALESSADEICLVPEKRAEVTTEGGLDALRFRKKLSEVIPMLQARGMLVSLFIDPDLAQLEAASELQADFVELHTGCYANAESKTDELGTLARACERAAELGLRVNAGHGLNYANVVPVARLPHLEELNIGHAIVGRSLFVGVAEAVREMKHLIAEARA